MPYDGELANKSSHADIVRNPDVALFLDGCDFLKPPSDKEARVIVARFQVAPTTDGVTLPQNIIAVDGSFYESSIDERLPSTKIGYVKIGSVLINMNDFDALRDARTGLVDPMRVARLRESNSSLVFTLPSANILWNGRTSVRDGFRAASDAYLYGRATRFTEDDPSTSLRTTLFHLASRRPGSLGTGDPSRLLIHKCPTCEEGPAELWNVPDVQFCPFCKAEIFPSDCLRIWEEVSDFQSNAQALSRFMLAVEHMMPIHYIRYLEKTSLSALCGLSFFIDGPLAIFANPAWLYAPIMRYLYEINRKLESISHQHVLLIGLQKSGQVVDHVNQIDRFVPINRIFSLDDEYRYSYILMGRERASVGFGTETYYGQDFIYKTARGRTFVLGLPYPFASKSNPTIDFVQAKTELGRYPDLARALALIDHFESDLYKNAVVPIALAHRYTAISLVPGGRVLDLLTRRELPPTD